MESLDHPPHPRWHLTPCTAPLGARVEGVDLSAPLSPADRAWLHDAWMRYLVLIFPGQAIGDEALVRFTRHFGEPEVFHQDIIKSRRVKEIFRVANVDEADNLLPPDDLTVSQLRSAQMWHTDSSYREIPSMGSLLHGREVTSTGGETLFSNMYAVLEALPTRLREQIETRKARHNFAFIRTIRNLPALSEEEAARMPPVWQPMVRKHPVTGRSSLYISVIYNDEVEGLSPERSQALIEELAAFAGQERFVYRHRWQVGDVVMWDNRCTVHQVTPFPSDARRVLHRTTIVGEEPVLAG